MAVGRLGLETSSATNNHLSTALQNITREEFSEEVASGYEARHS